MMQAKEGNRTARLVVGSACYQGVWFATVLSAGEPTRWWWGVLSTLGFLGFVLLAWPPLRVRVLVLTLAAIVCGLVVDTAMIAGGIWSSPRMLLPAPLPPLWLVMLWAAFGIYIALGLEMLYGRYGVSAMIGALGGMLAYRGGAALGAIQWGEPAWVTTVLLMIAWAIAFPALIWCAAKLQRAQAQTTPALPRMRVALMSIGLAGCFLLPAGNAHALEGDSSLFPETLRIGEHRVVRQGVGRMRRWMITGADVALYTEPGLPASRLLEDVPRALSFYYYVKIRADQFASSGLEALQANSADLLEQQRDSLATFNESLADVRRGDRYLLTYIPGEGTVLYLNGKKQGRMDGAAFGELYFRIWLGNPSIDARMYEAFVANMTP